MDVIFVFVSGGGMVVGIVVVVKVIKLDIKGKCEELINIS